MAHLWDGEPAARLAMALQYFFFVILPVAKINVHLSTRVEIMIRGLISRSAKEVRVKLLYRPFGWVAMAGAWTAADRWFVERTFSGDTLLLGSESDLDTRRRLSKHMRRDLTMVAIPWGIFQDRVRQFVDFGVPKDVLASGPDFGAYWTMAAGFGPNFRQDLSRLAATGQPERTFSIFLHERDILDNDGPSVVLYRNHFEDETSLRMRPNV
jgi:hypothetical protein